jgi:MFS transporter, AAHS family, 4-hydroxybenzoate transporter
VICAKNHTKKTLMAEPFPESRKLQSVSSIIDNQPLSFYQVRTMLLCCFVLFADGFDAQTIGFLAPSIAENTNIPVNTFGPIFSASLLGLMIAAMAAGPVADRWGRKWPIIFSTFTLALFSLLTANSTTFNQLLVFRFLTGLGLGGALPNVLALSSEYLPKRLLVVLVAVLFCGLPLGGFVCGMLSSAMAPVWGWRSVFYVGGILPLVLSFLLIRLLPESVQFLCQRQANAKRIADLLARLAPEMAGAEVSFPPPRVLDQKGIPIKYLFTHGRALGTVLLWIPNFMNLLLMYVIVNWLPALLRAAGMSATDGVTATAFFSFGGIVGTFAEGFLIRYYGPFRILVAEFGLCGLLIASMAGTNSWSLMVILAFLLGFLVTGAQAGLNVLAAQFYPVSIRSTGVGWALGLGRIGSIVGPLLAGILLSRNWRPWQVLLAGVIPAILAMCSILLSRCAAHSETPYS